MQFIYIMKLNNIYLYLKRDFEELFSSNQTYPYKIKIDAGK